MELLRLTPDIEVAHLGPPKGKGRLPAIFYFALSASESLELDPYNQPIVPFQERDVRIFSINLPAHGPGLSALDAMGAWASDFEHGIDPLTPCIDTVLFAIEELQNRGLVIKEKIGVMGLSRGGLIASHVAAKNPHIRAAALFAPVTDLAHTKEFASVKESPLVKALSTDTLIDALCRRPVSIYIGNRDVRVNTRSAFNFAEKLAEASYECGLRTPPVEMTITPSMGQGGHGTSKETFEAGSHWLAKKLGVVL